MINSTVSKESAPKSFVKDASGVTSDASTPNFSTMMLLTFSAISDILLKFLGLKNDANIRIFNWIIKQFLF
jgi:hypothetical protein